jgi:predicted enzyme related to lactoylglutathione lyase
MLKHFTYANIWVNDQDEALAFYTDTLGLELREDVTLAEMGGYRWLTVGPPGQPEVGFILNVPGPPVMDAATAAQVLDLAARGVIGGYHFSTDDCRATYAELSARGVEFSEEPMEMPYGIDAQFRDPSGNQFRLTQLVG